MIEIVKYQNKYIEEFFKSIKCQYVLVAVFSYNTSDISFYNKKGYHDRMHTMIKDIRR